MLVRDVPKSNKLSGDRVTKVEAMTVKGILTLMEILHVISEWILVSGDYLFSDAINGMKRPVVQVFFPIV